MPAVGTVAICVVSTTGGTVVTSVTGAVVGTVVAGVVAGAWVHPAASTRTITRIINPKYLFMENKFNSPVIKFIGFVATVFQFKNKIRACWNKLTFFARFSGLPKDRADHHFRHFISFYFTDSCGLWRSRHDFPERPAKG